MARLVLAAFLACILVAPTDAADAKYIKIIHVKTGKTLAVDKDSEEAGARAVLAEDNDSKARQWKLEKDGDYYKVINRQSGKVLDVFEESKETGAPIVVWDGKLQKNDNQLWVWLGSGKERRLKSKSSAFVLDVDDEGRLIQQKPNDKAESQLWRIVEIEE